MAMTAAYGGLGQKRIQEAVQWVLLRSGSSRQLIRVMTIVDHDRRPSCTWFIAITKWMIVADCQSR
jgi:hypothetical protein